MKEVLTELKPGVIEKKKFKLIIGEFLKKINNNLVDAKAILGGSGAKDTWLSGNHDIDIFVQYNYHKYEDKSNELSDYLQKSLKKSFPKLKISRVHGSRDYFKFSYKNKSFEVVPILKINVAKQAINITDISPLHEKWVNKFGKKVKDDIRLVKQFCRANKLYGAESYISGFSGYVLEILTINYGSFEGLLQASKKWKDKEIIDFSEFYEKKMALFHINKSKLNSPLIIVDPVDKERNAAAALSMNKVLTFKRLAKSYLKKPNKSFFEMKELVFQKLKDEANDKKLIFLTIKPLQGKEDVIGSKLLKVFNLIKKELGKFLLLKSNWDWNQENKEAYFYFILEKEELAKYEVREGPQLKMKEFVKDFKKKNKDCFNKDGRVMARIKVRDPKLNKFIEHLLKNNYIKERINKIKSVKYNF